MIGYFAQPDRRLFLLRTVLPIFAAALVLNAAASLLLFWATVEADQVAVDRQRGLVELIVSQMRSRIAHDQESITVWDDAVNAVRRRDDSEWIDMNLGSWMGTYFGHDRAYILDPLDRPIYAYADGAQPDPAAFQAISTEAMPLIADLRARLRAGDTEGLSDQILSLGAADLSIIAGRPAIVSVKPIVSDSGKIEQVPGEEYVHVAVRYLDDSFIADLRRDYLLGGLHFSWTDERARTEAAAILQAHGGRTIGYFIWEPFRPGSTVLWRVAPAMAALCLVSMLALGLFIAALRKRSLELSLSEATIRHLAHHDVLTGLPNRAQFASRVDEALKRLEDNDSLALLYLDLDHFKEVNDTLGHPAGDELLREFADRLRRLTSEGDTVARIGGDEFLILLRSAAQHQIEKLCQAILEAARHPFDLSGNQVFVGVSIGVAVAPKHGLERVELARRSDVALYHAKRSGRSGYAIYAAEMDGALKARRALKHDLRAALQTKDQLQVYYQPLLSVADSRITGVEALLRWRHPNQGWISPAVFIPLAEESGLIERLGEWVLSEACSRAASWPIETLAVNVSVMELQKSTFAMRVVNVLMANGMNPRRLELEVTESAFSDRTGDCERNIAALRELGVRFALDDFGTGFSSLGRLHQLSVDRLKIDRSFVDGFGKGNGDEAIVRAITDLARAIGLKTTAEGVETQQQMDYLLGLGCDDLQGYLISKPIPASQVEELLGVTAPAAEGTDERQSPPESRHFALPMGAPSYC